jgi:hypothetical protein
MMSGAHQGWIGVDLDGTLAMYDGWQGESHIGQPIPLMHARIKKWMEEGQEVRIFTARISHGNVQETSFIIDEWCKRYFGRTFLITCKKDSDMIELWDDRCVQVIPNTGQRADGKER